MKNVDKALEKKPENRQRTGHSAERPLIIIAGLKRTGTTVLSEALTRIPYSFILREPSFCRGAFNLKTQDADYFSLQDIDLVKYAARGRTFSARIGRKLHAGGFRMVRMFHDEILPELLSVVQQVGIKEIHHEGWRAYLKYFPHSRLILTGRDPRDIYISYHSWVHNQRGSWSGPFSPKRVADHLMRDFQMQRDMEGAFSCIKVKYEELCREGALLRDIKMFVQSPIPGIGAIGGFNASNPRRRDEYQIHGDAITANRVCRWKQERDSLLVKDAHEVFDLMRDYCEYWEYE